MLHQLIDHSPDLKRLRDEGYEVEYKGGFLLIRHIPYVNAERQIQFGILVTELTLQSADITAAPGTHVIYFKGNHPCNQDGSIISAIKHSSNPKELFKDFTTDHMFSNKPIPGSANYFPPSGYKDYYHKVTSYINVISAPAKSIDDTLTEKTFFVAPEECEESVFNYPDTNASRANFNIISTKLYGQKIAIIGLGGTGSYILDFLAKTPVQEIHLFDEDRFSLHNAFRAPGAPTAEQLKAVMYKVTYLAEIYSKMHKHIIPHEYYLIKERFSELKEMHFVFIAIDEGKHKKDLIEYLISNDIPFVDVGIGLTKVNDKLIGTVRTTSANKLKSDHLKKRVSLADDENEDDEYKSNIQIAELNAMNAAFAIIKWKKLFEFYDDVVGEFHSTYTINDSLLLNEDEITT